jgi:choline kinase
VIVRAIVLAAGLGSRLKPHTDTTPKCLFEVGGKPLLRRYLEMLAVLGIPEAVVVVGHLKEQVKAEVAQAPASVAVRLIENDRFTRGGILSLWLARQEFDDDVLIMDADVLFPQELLARLLASPDPNAIAVDEQFQDTGEGQKVLCEDGWVVEVAGSVGQDSRHRGEAVGLLRLSSEAAEVLRGVLEELIETGMESAGYQEALRDLAAEVPIGVVEVGDLPWIGIDVEEDLTRARRQILPQIDRLDRGESLPGA